MYGKCDLATGNEKNRNGEKAAWSRLLLLGPRSLFNVKPELWEDLGACTETVSSEIEIEFMSKLRYLQTEIKF